MRIPFRGYSSVGRAFEWHSKGQGFDSPYLHHKKENGKEAGAGSSFFVYRVCNLRLGADAGGDLIRSLNRAAVLAGPDRIYTENKGDCALVRRSQASVRAAHIASAITSRKRTSPATH